MTAGTVEHAGGVGHSGVVTMIKTSGRTGERIAYVSLPKVPRLAIGRRLAARARAVQQLAEMGGADRVFVDTTRHDGSTYWKEARWLT